MKDTLMNKKTFTTLITLIAVVALAFCLTGCAAETYKDKAEVKINVACADDLSAATPAKVAVYKADDEGKATEEKAIEETEVKLNEDSTLGELEAGKYVLAFSALPTLEDGSAYEADRSEVAFEVVKEDKADAKVVIPDTEETTIKVTLSKVASDEMTEEQLEAAAKALEASGKSEAAAATKNKAATAPSKSASNGSSSSNAGSNTGSSNNGGSSASNGGASGNTHTHNWQAVYTQVAAGEYIQCSCGATFANQSAWSAHSQDAGRGSSHSYSVKTKYEKQLLGYECTICHASK